MKRLHLATVLLLALILVLGYSLDVRQRREARLRAALALFKGRARRDIEQIMDRHHLLVWPDRTSLSEAIQQIRQATSRWGSFPNGVPIYVDADGLREAGQSLGSPVAAPPPDDPETERLSLRQELRILLEPLGLAAEVRDAAIVITSRGRAQEPAAAKDQERAP